MFGVTATLLFTPILVVIQRKRTSIQAVQCHARLVQVYVPSVSRSRYNGVRESTRFSSVSVLVEAIVGTDTSGSL